VSLRQGSRPGWAETRSGSVERSEIEPGARVAAGATMANQFCTILGRVDPDANWPWTTLVSTALTKAIAINMVLRTEATSTKLSIRMTVLLVTTRTAERTCASFIRSSERGSWRWINRSHLQTDDGEAIVLRQRPCSFAVAKRTSCLPYSAG
jgi:hypothetical protein